jgi:hypothetical protein
MTLIDLMGAQMGWLLKEVTQELPQAGNLVILLSTKMLPKASILQRG